MYRNSSSIQKQLQYLDVCLRRKFNVKKILLEILLNSDEIRDLKHQPNKALDEVVNYYSLMSMHLI